MKKCFLIDLDGSLFVQCPFLEKHLSSLKTRSDWDNYHKSYPWVEEINFEVLDLINKYILTGLTPIILTGREDRNDVKLKTMSALPIELKYVRVIMRSDGDFRSNADFKREKVLELQQEGCQIVFAIEDNPSVVEMLVKEHSVNCFFVAQKKAS